MTTGRFLKLQLESCRARKPCLALSKSTTSGAGP